MLLRVRRDCTWDWTCVSRAFLHGPRGRGPSLGHARPAEGGAPASVPVATGIATGIAHGIAPGIGLVFHVPFRTVREAADPPWAMHAQRREGHRPRCPLRLALRMALPLGLGLCFTCLFARSARPRTLPGPCAPSGGRGTGLGAGRTRNR